MTFRSLNRPQTSTNSVLVSPFHNYGSDSPQSSLTSSNFTSVSQHRGGPAKMPSSNFKKYFFVSFVFLLLLSIFKGHKGYK